MQKVFCLSFVLAAFVTVLSKIRSWPRSKAILRNEFNSHHPRVLEGWSDINDEYPFVVTFINDEGQRACTASLITTQWVLTAAHCLFPHIRYIRCGNMTAPWPKTKCKSKVLKMFPHPAFLKGKIDFLQADIGIALVEEIATKKFGRVHTADYKTLMGRAVRFAGFGATYPSYIFSLVGEDKAREIDENKPLQIGEGVIFDDKSVEDSVISIAPKCTNIRHSPYFGDSGGPLFVDNKIVGVLSGGGIDHTQSKSFVNEKHSEINYYTAVSPYLGWIKITMNSKH